MGSLSFDGFNMYTFIGTLYNVELPFQLACVNLGDSIFGRLFLRNGGSPALIQRCQCILRFVIREEYLNQKRSTYATQCITRLLPPFWTYMYTYSIFFEGPSTRDLEYSWLVLSPGLGLDATSTWGGSSYEWLLPQLLLIRENPTL